MSHNPSFGRTLPGRPGKAQGKDRQHHQPVPVTVILLTLLRLDLLQFLSGDLPGCRCGGGLRRYRLQRRFQRRQAEAGARVLTNSLNLSLSVTTSKRLARSM